MDNEVSNPDSGEPQTAPIEVGGQDAENTEAPPLTLDDVTKEYFSPDQIPQGEARVGEYIEAGFDVRFNFKPEDEFPSATHGLLIAPIAQRVKGKNIKIGLVAVAVPVLTAVNATAAGQAFVEGAVRDKLSAKVINAMRDIEPGGESYSLDETIPLTVEEYITTKRSNTLVAYNKVAPMFVRALVKKGLRKLNVPLLGDILASAAVAERVFPSVSQEVWEGIINKMEGVASSANYETGIYFHWLETRAETEDSVAEVVLSLDDLGI